MLPSWIRSRRDMPRSWPPRRPAASWLRSDHVGRDWTRIRSAPGHRRARLDRLRPENRPRRQRRRAARRRRRAPRTSAASRPAGCGQRSRPRPCLARFRRVRPPPAAPRRGDARGRYRPGAPSGAWRPSRRRRARPRARRPARSDTPRADGRRARGTWPAHSAHRRLRPAGE